MSRGARRRARAGALAVLALLALSAPGPAAAQAPARALGPADVVYMIMVDRFANGDPANDRDAVRGDPRAFHGGDLAGVLQRLDYVADLGVSVLWLSPLYPNPPRGYHGYWPLELRGVDPRFGDLGTLRALVEAAHARGLKVLLDHVVNHTAPEHPWRRDPAKRGWYHDRGDIRDWSDPAEVEQGDLFGLPDLAQEHPAVAGYLLETARWWLEQTGADGFRLDAAKHVPLAFWRRFAAEVRQVRPDAFLLAEVLERDLGRLGPYLEAGLDAAFDFALQGAIVQTFAHGQGLFPVRSALALRARAVPDPSRLATLVDNHDLPRFLYEAGYDRRPDEAVARLRAALTFLLTIPGIPVLYYGTETGMTGGPDPYNRGDMRFDDHPELRAWVAGLIRLRRTEPALWGPRLELLPVSGAPRLLVYVRYPEPGAGRARPALVAIQADGRPAPAAAVTLPADALPRGGRLRPLYGTGPDGGPILRARGGAAPAVTLPPLGAWEARVYRLEPAAGPPPLAAALLGGLAAAAGAVLWQARRRAGGGRR